MHEREPTPEKFRLVDLEINFSPAERDEIRHYAETLTAEFLLAETMHHIEEKVFAKGPAQGPEESVAFPGFYRLGKEFIKRGNVIARNSGIGDTINVSHVPDLPGFLTEHTRPDCGLGPIRRDNGKMLIVFTAIHAYASFGIVNRPIAQDAFYQSFGFMYNVDRPDTHFRAAVLQTTDSSEVVDLENRLITALAVPLSLGDSISTIEK